MLASDPYHRVRDGGRYPGKLVARIQGASAGPPVLLRVAWEGGHGSGTARSAVHEEWAYFMPFARWAASAHALATAGA